MHFYAEKLHVSIGIMSFAGKDFYVSNNQLWSSLVHVLEEDLL